MKRASVVLLAVIVGIATDAMSQDKRIAEESKMAGHAEDLAAVNIPLSQTCLARSMQPNARTCLSPQPNSGRTWDRWSPLLAASLLISTQRDG